jgi:hypothetical protein
LENPLRFTELKLEFRKNGFNQNWFSNAVIHMCDPAEDFLVSKKMRFLILGGLID